MAFIPIRQIGAGGIVTDQAPYDLELQQFPVGNNVAIEDGKIGKALGYSNRQGLAFQPTHVQGWLYQGNNTLVIGGNTSIHRFDGTTVSDVSKVGGYSNSPRWQSAQIGTAVVMNNGAEVPQYMLPTGSAFADLPAWPTNVTTQCLKPFNSFLVMVGYEDLSSRYPFTVRWSDEYDPASVPGSWDITSTTNLAGENVLSGNSGELVDQLTLNDANIIYAERGVYAMTYIGAPLVFAFREVFADDGIINRGAVAGFFGGKIDSLMMRIVDIMYALPFTIFVILLMVFFGRDIWLLFLAIGAVEWLTMARIVRGQIMSLKKMEFIEAARSIGLGKRRIIFRHMIPNILGPIIVYTTLTIPAVMLLEAFLSFLGLGVQPPLSSWGVLIKDGAEKMEEYPWLLMFPGVVFSLTLFSLNFLGDGLRDALDVRSSKD